MRNEVIGGFRRLRDFQGRVTPGEFWLFAAVVLGLYFSVGFAGGVLITYPLIEAMFAIQGGAEPSSELLDRLDEQFDGTAQRFILFTLLMTVSYYALLAAAVARRLHDIGRSARWGLLPIPFAAYGMGAFWVTWYEDFPTNWLFDSAAAAHALYGLAVLGLIVLLALPGSPAPNRYGERR